MIKKSLKSLAGTKMTECQNQSSIEHDSSDILLRLLLSVKICTNEMQPLWKKGWNRALLWEKGWVFVKGKKCVNTHRGTVTACLCRGQLQYYCSLFSLFILFTGRMFLIIQHVQIPMNHAQTGTLDEMAREINTTPKQQAIKSRNLLIRAPHPTPTPPISVFLWCVVALKDF